MRRGNRRQKRNAAEQNWCKKGFRRLYGLSHRPGYGKSVKRAMARRRRREPIEFD